MRKIVFVNDDPAKSVEELFDADVIGLPITISFLLKEVWNHLRPSTFPSPFKIPMTGDPWFEWVLQSQKNYEEMWNYGMDILDEYSYRFGSRAMVPYKHGSTRLMESLQDLPNLPAGDVSEMPFTVEQMRDQYRQSREHWDTFTRREKPEWLN